jgi:hypothetical protein
MPQPRRIQHGGRYDYRAVTLRIERMRVACGVERKELFEAVGIAQSQFSKKLTGLRSTFSLKEMGDIADFFAARTGRALIGWPLIDAEVSDLLDARRR